MKAPQQDLKINTRLVSYNIMKVIPVFTGIAFFILSCVNDPEKVKELTSKTEYPVQSAVNIEIVDTEDGYVIRKAFAQELQRFEIDSNPYTVFPKGLEVLGYENYPEVAYSIRADYAINWEKTNLWEARTNVVAVSVDGDTLVTDQLF